MSLDNPQRKVGFQSPMMPAAAPTPAQPSQQPQPQAWPPNPNAAVSIRGLFKHFDRKIAVNGLALDIPVGSFYGLVGPNGAGKTTTLNMVTGLLVPDAGTIIGTGVLAWFIGILPPFTVNADGFPLNILGPGGIVNIVVVLVGALTGRWAQPDDLATGLIFLATGMGIALSGLGVAEVTSCVLMYPVASMDKPFSAPQGRAMAQGFFPFVYMLGSLLLMLPTGIVALVMLLTGAEGGMWLAIIPVALANGIGILALGTWLGGKLMDARMLSIVATLDSFASLQK